MIVFSSENSSSPGSTWSAGCPGSAAPRSWAAASSSAPPRSPRRRVAGRGRHPGEQVAAAPPQAWRAAAKRSVQHMRTRGMIGSLSHLVRASAQVAILEGQEAITRKLMETIPVDYIAESGGD